MSIEFSASNSMNSGHSLTLIAEPLIERVLVLDKRRDLGEIVERVG